jgi:hypothetical protein
MRPNCQGALHCQIWVTVCDLQKSGVNSSSPHLLFLPLSFSRSLSCHPTSLSYCSDKHQLVLPVGVIVAVKINTTKGLGNGIALLHDSLTHHTFQNTMMTNPSHCPLIGIIVDRQTKTRLVGIFDSTNHLKVCSSTSRTIVNPPLMFSTNLLTLVSSCNASVTGREKNGVW